MSYGVLCFFVFSHGFVCSVVVSLRGYYDSM